VHFDVLAPLLTELRSWPGTVLLKKVKSHAGCLLNERANALADLGALSEEEQIFPGPSKSELSGYVHACPGGIGSDQSNITTSSLEIGLQTRISLSRSLQSIFSEPWQIETRISCDNSSAEKRAGFLPG
jgi:hypothetical protein